MARKPAGGRSAKTTWAAPKLAGKSFAFTGTLRHSEREDVAQHVRAEGGRVANSVTADVDYLVVGATRSGQPTQAEQKAQRLNQKQGAAIQIIDEDQLHEMCKPTPEEVLAMLTGGPQGLRRWKQLTDNWRFSAVDLRGLDLRKVSLGGTDLSRLSLEGINFKGAHLEGVTIHGAENCTFDGAILAKANVSRCKNCSFVKANLSGASVYDMRHCTFDGACIAADVWGAFSGDLMDCSVKNADLRGVRLNPADVSRSDFTGAKMSVRVASFTVAHDAVFRAADLSGTELRESKFDRADFTGANLSRAKLHKSVFAAAQLVGAKLVAADLREATFRGADLSGADLHKANLAGAVSAERFSMAPTSREPTSTVRTSRAWTCRRLATWCSSKRPARPSVRACASWRRRRGRRAN